MNEGVLLDTSVIVAHFREDASLATRFKESALYIPQTAHHGGRINAQLHKAGKTIPQNDIWIAAVALEHNLPVATRDEHFEYVEGLRRF
jgi:predicted nucleic acid-binding protein